MADSDAPRIVETETATPEEVQRVRQMECRNGGHDFEILPDSRRNVPLHIFCSRCGASWSVEAAQALSHPGPSQPRSSAR